MDGKYYLEGGGPRAAMKHAHNSPTTITTASASRYQGREEKQYFEWKTSKQYVFHTHTALTAASPLIEIHSLGIVFCLLSRAFFLCCLPFFEWEKESIVINGKYNRPGRTMQMRV